MRRWYNGLNCGAAQKLDAVICGVWGQKAANKVACACAIGTSSTFVHKSYRVSDSSIVQECISDRSMDPFKWVNTRGRSELDACIGEGLPPCPILTVELYFIAELPSAYIGGHISVRQRQSEISGCNNITVWLNLKILEWNINILLVNGWISYRAVSRKRWGKAFWTVVRESALITDRPLFQKKNRNKNICLINDIYSY